MPTDRPTTRPARFWANAGTFVAVGLGAAGAEVDVRDEQRSAVGRRVLCGICHGRRVPEGGGGGKPRLRQE